MNAGRLTMNVLVEGKHIGVAVSEQEVSFRFGTNNTHTFTVTLTRHNDNALYIEKLVSNYTSGARCLLARPTLSKRVTLLLGLVFARLRAQVSMSPSRCKVPSSRQA